MKLSDSIAQHLFDLAIAAGRPTDDTPALVKAGLAVAGRGRYGDYARITETGLALVKSWPDRKRLEHDVEYHREITADALTAHDAAIVSKPRVKRGVASANSPTPSNTPPTEPLKAGATYSDQTVVAATRAAGEKLEPAKVKRERPRPAPTSPGRARRPARRETPAKLSPPAPSVTPNALRVESPTQVVYYPLTTKLSHGARKVFTRNKLFKPYRVGSPDTDADVLL
jgi:hypothetical protein